MEKKVSMPLSQQDEFGVLTLASIVIIVMMSQCRFRSKMNSEQMMIGNSDALLKGLNAALAAR